jgi:hypothetical protein
VERREQGRSSYCTSQPIKEVDAKSQASLLRAACKDSKSQLEALTLKVTEIQELQQEFLELREKLEERAHSILDNISTTGDNGGDSEKEEDETIAVRCDQNWESGMKLLQTSANSSTKCLKRAARLNNILSSDTAASLPRDKLQTISKELLECVSSCTVHCRNAEEYFQESSSLRQVQKKWAVMEELMNSLLQLLQHHHNSASKIKELTQQYRQLSNKQIDALDRAKKAADDMVSFGWKAYSKVCGNSRGKRARTDRLNTVRLEIKKLRTDYANELGDIEANQGRFSGQFFTHAYDEMLRFQPEKGTLPSVVLNAAAAPYPPHASVQTSRVLGFDNLESVWSMKFQPKAKPKPKAATTHKAK